MWCQPGRIPNPCFNLYGICDFAWGPEMGTTVAALKAKTKQTSPNNAICSNMDGPRDYHTK